MLVTIPEKFSNLKVFIQNVDKYFHDLKYLDFGFKTD